jgi:MFS family permease
MIPVGFCIGAAEVAFPAFGEAVSGDRALSGPLIALWSLGSLLAGLAYGAYGHRVSPATAYERGMLVLPLVTLPLALPGSFAAMVPLTLLAGVAIAPLLTAANQVISDVAPRGALIEAYTWPITALVVGVTSGNAASGAVIEALDWRAAFVVAGVFGAAGLLVVAARRATLHPAAAPSSG